jgi:anti-sigma B factor antagonist
MLQHNIRRAGDVTIVDLNGRMSLTDTIWAGGSTVLVEVIHGLVNSGERKILLNFSGVTYVDSSGIGDLTAAMVALQRQKGQLKLLSPTAKVIDVLRFTRLDTLLEIKDDENSAIQSFSNPCQKGAAG